MKKLEHGMLLRSKNVMDDAMCELESLRELIPEVLHPNFEKIVASFEDTLCTADVSEDYVKIERTR